MSKSLIDIKPFLLVSPDVVEICQPLRTYGITHFSYVNNFNDGTQIKLGDAPDWQEHYYLNDLQKVGLYEGVPDWYDTGYTLWSSITSPEQELSIVKEAREFIGADYAIVICKKHKDCCEFFFFAGDKN